MQAKEANVLKLHLSLPVADLAATEAFYATLFNAQPSKSKGDYLKFEPDELALNISFAPVGVAKRPETNRHLGIQFPSQEDLDLAYERLSAANLVHGIRESSICCYANQDKFWVSDPDGYRWELYYLVSDSDARIEMGTGCCATESERSHCC